MRLSRGEERQRSSRKGSAEALGIKTGRSVPPEWPSFGLLAHQIAAFSFFFRPFNGFGAAWCVRYAAGVRGSLGSC